MEQAEHKLDEHTAPRRPGDRKYRSRQAGQDPLALREEQEAETAQGVTEGGPEHLTSRQWQGLVLGGLAGAVLGALVFLPLALIPFTDSVMTRVAWVALCGALAGATAGAVYWGGRLPELEGETMDVEGRPSIGTTLRDPHSDDRGR